MEAELFIGEVESPKMVDEFLKGKQRDSKRIFHYIVDTMDKRIVYHSNSCSCYWVRRRRHFVAKSEASDSDNFDHSAKIEIVAANEVTKK